MLIQILFTDYFLLFFVAGPLLYNGLSRFIDLELIAL